MPYGSFRQRISSSSQRHRSRSPIREHRQSFEDRRTINVRPRIRQDGVLISRSLRARGSLDPSNRRSSGRMLDRSRSKSPGQYNRPFGKVPSREMPMVHSQPRRLYADQPFFQLNNFGGRDGRNDTRISDRGDNRANWNACDEPINHRERQRSPIGHNNYAPNRNPQPFGIMDRGVIGGQQNSFGLNPEISEHERRNRTRDNRGTCVPDLMSCNLAPDYNRGAMMMSLLERDVGYRAGVGADSTFRTDLNRDVSFRSEIGDRNGNFRPEFNRDATFRSEMSRDPNFRGELIRDVSFRSIAARDIDLQIGSNRDAAGFRPMTLPREPVSHTCLDRDVSFRSLPGRDAGMHMNHGPAPGYRQDMPVMPRTLHSDYSGPDMSFRSVKHTLPMRKPISNLYNRNSIVKKAISTVLSKKPSSGHDHRSTRSPVRRSIGTVTSRHIVSSERANNSGQKGDSDWRRQSRSRESLKNSFGTGHRNSQEPPISKSRISETSREVRGLSTGRTNSGLRRPTTSHPPPLPPRSMGTGARMFRGGAGSMISSRLGWGGRRR